jgi:anti-sigma-K factor RskA
LSDSGAIDPRGLLPGYASGALSPEERAAVERLLAEDPTAAVELRDWEETLGRLAEGTADAVEPRGAARRALLERVASIAAAAPAAVVVDRDFAARQAPLDVDRAPALRSLRPSMAAALALAASLAALVVSLIALRQQTAGRVEVAALRAEGDRLDRRVNALQDDLGRTGRNLEQLASAMRAATFPGRQPIVLAGLEGAPNAAGAAFYHPAAREAVFYAYGLPGLAADRTYQLWYIVDSGPISAGVFAVDQRGEATVDVAGLPEPSRINAWAVSVEPAGGVERPTGPIVAASG